MWTAITYARRDVASFAFAVCEILALLTLTACQTATHQEEVLWKGRSLSTVPLDGGHSRPLSRQENIRIECPNTVFEMTLERAGRSGRLVWTSIRNGPDKVGNTALQELQNTLPENAYWKGFGLAFCQVEGEEGHTRVAVEYAIVIRNGGVKHKAVWIDIVGDEIFISSGRDSRENESHANSTPEDGLSNKSGFTFAPLALVRKGYSASLTLAFRVPLCQHFALSGMVWGADNSFLFKSLNQAGGLVVANLQAALKIGCRGALIADHHGHGLRI